MKVELIKIQYKQQTKRIIQIPPAQNLRQWLPEPPDEVESPLNESYAGFFVSVVYVCCSVGLVSVSATCRKCWMALRLSNLPSPPLQRLQLKKILWKTTRIPVSSGLVNIFDLRYSLPAAAKSAAGICTPVETIRIHLMLRIECQCLCTPVILNGGSGRAAFGLAGVLVGR